MIIRTNKRVHSEKYILKVLFSKDPNLKVVKVDKVYYPYALMAYRIQMKNPKSIMNRKILCVIDQMAGRGAIGNADPSLVEIEVDDVMVMDAKVTGQELYDKAYAYVFKIMLGKIRVLYVPKLVLEKEDYFHKLYYIIHCKGRDSQDCFLMADSMDAHFTFLEPPDSDELLDVGELKELS